MYKKSEFVSLINLKTLRILDMLYFIRFLTEHAFYNKVFTC